jgi:hypothetical protein
MPLFSLCDEDILLAKSTKSRPSASAPACAQLSDLCFAWWSSPPLLPGYRALFNSHCAPRTHNLLQKGEPFSGCDGEASLNQAPYPALLVFWTGSKNRSGNTALKQRDQLYALLMRNEFAAVIGQDGKWFAGWSPEIPDANGQGRNVEERRASHSADSGGPQGKSWLNARRSSANRGAA